MTYLEHLIAEIQQNFADAICAEDYLRYQGRYYEHCVRFAEILPTGFCAWVAFGKRVSTEFREAFRLSGVELKQAEPHSLHDYDLKLTGMQRIQELENKIRQIKELL